GTERRTMAWESFQSERSKLRQINRITDNMDFAIVLGQSPADIATAPPFETIKTPGDWWMDTCRASPVLKRTCYDCCGISCAASRPNAPCRSWKTAVLSRLA